MNVQLAAAVAGRRLPVLDRLGDRLQPVVQSLLNAGGRRPGNLLDGVWLSTPLHPPVTDVPLGAATTAVLLDTVAAVTRSPRADRQADGALAVAVLGALGALATGLAEWRWMRGGRRRAASVHGLLNLAGFGLNAGSLLARRSGRRITGRALATLGLLTSGVAAHIGGELAFGLGFRVNPNDPTATGDEVATLAADDLADHGLHAVRAGPERVLVARCSDGTVCAIAARCSHLGGPLEQGRRDGDTVVCPWHGSRFDLRTGAVVAGPAVFPQTRYTVTERDGRIEVRHDDSPVPFVIGRHRTRP